MSGGKKKTELQKRKTESLESWEENREIKRKVFPKTDGYCIECYWDIKQEIWKIIIFCYRKRPLMPVARALSVESLESNPNRAFRVWIQGEKVYVSSVNNHLQKLDYEAKGRKGRNDDYEYVCKCACVWRPVTLCLVGLSNTWYPARKKPQKSVCSCFQMEKIWLYLSA